MPENRIRPVILSGGAGTRLWPVSNAEGPKQLQALTGAKTMLQMTACRTADPELFLPPTVVANARHADEVEAQLRQCGIAADPLIVEPCGRNTAPAIAAAALATAGEDLLLVMPSDHVIGDSGAFIGAIRTAVPIAAAGRLVTFGVRPDRPETGYGYIRRGAALAGGGFEVARFVEKPDRNTAEAYLAEGGYDWNAGIFLFRPGDVLKAFEAHAPDILASLRSAMAGAARSGDRIAPDPAIFASSPDRSFDHAVLEHASRIAVVPVAMDWSDLGSWDALYDAGEKDVEGNAAAGPVSVLDTRNCLIRSDGPKVVAFGVTDLIVVATRDAVLVAPRGESQRVREALEALKAEEPQPKSAG